MSVNAVQKSIRENNSGALPHSLEKLYYKKVEHRKSLETIMFSSSNVNEAGRPKNN